MTRQHSKDFGVTMRKKVSLFLLLLMLLFVPACVRAQESQYDKVCPCADQFYPRSGHDFDEVFDPSYIVQNKIKAIHISLTSKKMKITGKDTSYQGVHATYPLKIVYFNAGGFVRETHEYSGGFGDFFRITRYTRDAANRILATQGYYLDSTGKEVVSGGSHYDYTWEGDRLVKTKNREYDDVTILPDELSYYTTYAYDKSGRVIKEFHYYYFDEKNISKNIATTIYAKDNRSSVTTWIYDGKIGLIEKTIYDAYEAPLSIKGFDKKNKLIQEQHYKYDPEGRILEYRTKMYPGLSTECPDRGNTVNRFCYRSDGSYDRVIHYYGGTVCELRVEYR
jgi:hypothetical protein